MTVYPDEKGARHDIAEAGRRMYLRGLICAGDGNLSARISDTELIVTPSGVPKGFMTEDMLIKLDIGGNVLEGMLKPSSEIKMHLAIYKRTPEIIAICHAHPPAASAFAAAGVPLDKAFLQETLLTLGIIPVAKYAPPGSDKLADGVAALSGNHNGALLEHHGAVTWGKSVMEALYRMESVEFTATVAMYSKMMGFTKTLGNCSVPHC